MTGSVVACMALAAAAGGLAMPAPPRSLLARRLRGLLERGPAPIGWRSWPVLCRIHAARAAGRARAERRAAAREACDVLAAELLAGRTAGQALAAASGVLPELAPVAAVGRMGGDVPAALRAVRVAGTEVLELLAAAWTVAEESGAGLVVVLDRLVHGLRDDDALRQEISAQLAGPRATARLLAALPFLGLALGAGMGSDPVGFLIGTPYGLGCVLAGAALAAAGLVWVERLARSAEAPP